MGPWKEEMLPISLPGKEFYQQREKEGFGERSIGVLSRVHNWLTN